MSCMLTSPILIITWWDHDTLCINSRWCLIAVNTGAYIASYSHSYALLMHTPIALCSESCLVSLLYWHRSRSQVLYRSVSYPPVIRGLTRDHMLSRHTHSALHSQHTRCGGLHLHTRILYPTMDMVHAPDMQISTLRSSWLEPSFYGQCIKKRVRPIARLFGKGETYCIIRLFNNGYSFRLLC